MKADYSSEKEPYDTNSTEHALRHTEPEFMTIRQRTGQHSAYQQIILRTQLLSIHRRGKGGEQILHAWNTPAWWVNFLGQVSVLIYFQDEERSELT